MPFGDMVVGFGVPLAAFVTAVSIVALVGYYKDRERKLRHDTIRLALEKGQPLPPELLTRAEPVRNDLAGGIRLIFFGIGLGAFFWIFRPEHSLWAIGLMLAIIGVGRLVAHYVTARSQPAAPGRAGT